MKKYKCASDIGSVLIGNSDWLFAVPNKGGDGTTKVRVYDSEKEFVNSDWYNNGLEFVAPVYGKFSIFKNDTDKPSDRVHCTLSGSYFIYNGAWKVAFVKMGD